LDPGLKTNFPFSYDSGDEITPSGKEKAPFQRGPVLIVLVSVEAKWGEMGQRSTGSDSFFSFLHQQIELGLNSEKGPPPGGPKMWFRSLSDNRNAQLFK
jgi:hypothetical protein